MRTTWRTSAFTAIAALALTAGATSAQYAAPLDQGPADDAVELERQAREAAADRADWGKASILYRKAAELREGEPEAAEDYRMAGLLAFYVGREGTAVGDLAKAAETALAWGDVASAARSFLDAAWVASSEGHDRQALELAQKAERLARSPLLPRSDRAQLLSRIADGPQPPAMPALR